MGVVLEGLADEDESLVLYPVGSEGEGGEGRVVGEEGGKVSGSITRETVTAREGVDEHSSREETSLLP